jgi:polyribonucleotide nucleotidyltransferase
MVEAGAKEVTEDEMVTALDVAHQAIRQIIGTIEDLKREAGKPKKTVAPKAIGHDFYREVEERVYLPLAEAMRVREKLENYQRVDQVLEELVATIPEEEIERRSSAKHIFKDLKEKVMRDGSRARAALGGRRFDEIRPITIEVGVPSRARVGRLHAGRDTGARQRDTRTDDDARDRDGRRRDVALHAPLQLPAVLRGRGAVPPWTGTA